MTQYGARHLLIKFSGSRNPVSRRTNQSTADVTAEDEPRPISQLRAWADPEAAGKEAARIEAEAEAAAKAELAAKS